MIALFTLLFFIVVNAVAPQCSAAFLNSQFNAAGALCRNASTITCISGLTYDVYRTGANTVNSYLNLGMFGSTYIPYAVGNSSGYSLQYAVAGYCDQILGFCDTTVAGGTVPCCAQVFSKKNHLCICFCLICPFKNTRLVARLVFHSVLVVKRRIRRRIRRPFHHRTL